MKFAVCNEIFKELQWKDICDFVSTLGYEGVEIAPFSIIDDVRNIEERRVGEIRRVAEETGLAIIGLHWLLASPPGLHINHPDPSVRSETVDYMKQLIKFCKTLGGWLMVLGSPKQRMILPGVSKEDAWRWTKEFLLKVLDEAEKLGVFICIEPLSPKETNFINTAEEAVYLIEEISHPNLKLHLDVKAMSSEKENVEDIIKKNARYLKHFHANDASGRGPGLGDTDFRPIVRALKEINYDGYISVEIFDTYPSPEISAQKSLEYLKEVTGYED